MERKKNKAMGVHWLQELRAFQEMGKTSDKEIVVVKEYVRKVDKTPNRSLERKKEVDGKQLKMRNESQRLSQANT